ncbi:hypothetical protein N802_03085 [Knoellia sinensis KCTC 19936]|uniref:Uncharacterized protein n=1 Tax=Knoellia sinensis KCTC 19936 TaxID=1385520 RepID=A0A0A0J6H4_9MICO|nr:hypothetical protein [Knoellia sinensis]KGN31662.1 hypothetical protein N802_03085 [Knoellia sinensis KCTC 19936]
MWIRLVTALAALVSAAVHFILWWFQDYKDIDVIGPAFLLNAVAGVVIAVLLLRWHHWIPAFLVVGFGASTLGAFILSTTVGLFGVNEEWSGGWQLTAAASEVICILGGLFLLREGFALGRKDHVSKEHAHLP